MEIKYSKFLGDKPKQYAFDTISDKVSALEAKGIKMIDFGIGDPAKSMPPPQYIIDSMSEYAEKYKLAGYPERKGTKKFRESCCRYLKREFNVTIDFETEINATIGSKEAIFNFPKAFINPNDIVICPNPGYPPFYQGTEAANGIPYFVPLLEENNFLIDFEAIPKHIAKQAKLIWVNYPNSPTGIMAPREWLQNLVAWAHKNNIIIAADEGAYIDIYYDKKPTSILEITREGVIAFYSLSKRSNMTSYRIGFVAGDPIIIEGFLELKSRIDSGVVQFIQEAAAHALEDTEYISALRKQYNQKRKLLMSALERKNLPSIKSDSTFFLWQKAPDGMTGDELAEKLIEIGIVVIPGSILTQPANGKNPGKNYVRIALMPSLENIKLAAERITNELQL